MRKLLILLLLPALLSGCWKDDEGVDADTVHFTAVSGVANFTYAPTGKTLKIHYNIPASGSRKNMPVLLVMHGTDRDADNYLLAWKELSDAKGFMVFAPEFGTADFPADADYTQGDMFQGSTLKDEEQWGFSIIEALFDFIVKDLSGNQKTYDMWGHSAGAQFTHRYVMFKPYARLNRAVSANAGWYTLPDPTVDFPYGLKNSPVTSQTLGYSFGQRLTIQLGTADTNRDSNLNTSAGAEAQGTNRYERGKYFFNVANQKKTSYSAFAWEKREVAGVAHKYREMAADAASWLY